MLIPNDHHGVAPITPALVVVLALGLAACHSTVRVPSDTEGDDTPVGEPGITVGDHACPEAIFIPQSGLDAADPVPADPDAASFGSAPEPTRVRLSWVGDPSTTMAFNWVTDLDTRASRIQLGVGGHYGIDVAGASFTLLNGDAFGRVHEVHVCGLEPGRTYHYRVGGEGHWSADATFSTGPTPGSTEAFRFVLAGDSRDNPDVWGQILAASDAYVPDFILFSGDAVANGADLASWGTWLDKGVGYNERRPMMAVHGNHEFLAQPFFALFALPTDAGPERTDDEQWFSFDYGNGHFVFLNDTLAPYDVQATWMDADLKATTQPWKFVVHHQPAYSSCTTHGANLNLQTLWSPVEEENGVDFDLAGHNHNYERSVPLRGGVETDAAGGTTYVVSGGAGAPLYGNNMANLYTTAAAVEHNWVLMEVADDHVTLTAYDLGGNVLDRMTR